jgi:hypothetical protein
VRCPSSLGSAEEEWSCQLDRQLVRWPCSGTSSWGVHPRSTTSPRGEAVYVMAFPCYQPLRTIHPVLPCSPCSSTAQPASPQAAQSSNQDPTSAHAAVSRRTPSPSTPLARTECLHPVSFLHPPRASLRTHSTSSSTPLARTECLHPVSFLHPPRASLRTHSTSSLSHTRDTHLGRGGADAQRGGVLGGVRGHLQAHGRSAFAAAGLNFKATGFAI